MGTCRLCGQPAGFLRSQHKECLAKRDAAQARMNEVAQRSLREAVDRDALEAELRSIALGNFLDDSAVREALVAAWEDGVQKSLEDGVLTADEEQRLAAFKEAFSLEQSVLDRKGALSRLVKAGVLRDLMEGTLPQRVTVGGTLPVNLQKNEKIIWVFPNTQYLEDRVRREYVGGYQGASIRVAKGVYWRVGGFRGHPIEHTERTHVDTGVLVVTNKHVYFVGPSKSLRIRHDKIISLVPFDDGIGLHRDTAAAKPQMFRTGDGWFTYNLLSNVSNVAGAGA